MSTVQSSLDDSQHLKITHCSNFIQNRNIMSSAHLTFKAKVSLSLMAEANAEGQNLDNEEAETSNRSPAPDEPKDNSLSEGTVNEAIGNELNNDGVSDVIPEGKKDDEETQNKIKVTVKRRRSFFRGNSEPPPPCKEEKDSEERSITIADRLKKAAKRAKESCTGRRSPGPMKKEAIGNSDRNLLENIMQTSVKARYKVLFKEIMEELTTPEDELLLEEVWKQIAADLTSNELIKHLKKVNPDLADKLDKRLNALFTAEFKKNIKRTYEYGV